MASDELDRCGLLSVYSAYAHSMDGGDAQAWSECFTTDGVLWSSRGTRVEGRPRLERFASERISARTTPERHVSWHHVFTWHAGGAAGRCSAALLRPTATGVEVVFSATYRDVLRREDERWLLARREVFYDEFPTVTH